MSMNILYFFLKESFIHTKRESQAGTIKTQAAMLRTAGKLLQEQKVSNKVQTVQLQIAKKKKKRKKLRICHLDYKLNDHKMVIARNTTSC